MTDLSFKKIRLHSVQNVPGPILISSPGFLPDQKTHFTVSREEKSNEWIVEGDSGGIRYHGSTANKRGDSFFQYCIAVENQENDTFDMIPVPLIHLKCHVKSQKIHEDIEKNIEKKDYEKEKKELGETFGSKKMKKIIQNKAFNIIDTQQFEDISSHMINDVKEVTKNMSSLEEIHANTYPNLPIPPPNTQATKLEEVYSLSDIVTEPELLAIHVKAILQEQNERNRTLLLPFKNSRYVNEHLSKALKAEKKNKRHIKLLYYVSLLMAFYTNRHLVSKKELLIKKLGDLPLILIDHLITRFSEYIRSGTNYETIQSVITSHGMDKILCYLFALCLIIDNFSVDINLLAQDLSLSTQKCKGLFKTLGCKIQGCTEAQRLAMNLSKAEVKLYKRAVLTLPFEIVSKKQRKLR
ncbi:hypothetical protein PNEG_01352 [Pneumocystis murina B123]|uniref:DNA-directed RNA polymerase I subunit RPA49 n=1 Tax=Pneumocystis murina (strain B123) TaxID=1069680 RepID=M7NPL9_PNEMU|nr:hypothetical protein PNEG_01352 [Pneumocystis murina B123]EMR10653.1 hypothetical protein PNEG_01352 [Pneumocystis murina B123]